MLKLKNVSKFYYQNGIVTSGFSKVNLELHKGEFVAITGESGSGKSTLLNVISGLDSYEEGEMYINGEETSAYGSADFENYRRKYIANIYQSFNLISSYTVWQNVEMALMLSGVKRKEAKAKIAEILKKVDLYNFRNTKASKLSGGQKQRVAIARALVKDTPIIVADEPTGNLDSESAKNVIALLAELASDKLVVVVTHNYDQIEPYVTRKITMHDGRITEDLKLKDVKEEDAELTEEKDTVYDDIEKVPRHSLSFGSRFKLGARNSVNILPKFALLLFIFMFITSSVLSLYANVRSDNYNQELNGYNVFFNDLSDKRIIIKKADGSAISEEDFDKIKALDNVETIYKQDLLLDSFVFLECEEEDVWFYFDCKAESLEDSGISAEDLDYGRMPENVNEVILITYSDAYYNNEESIAQILSSDFVLDTSNYKVGADSKRISGIIFDDSLNWRSKVLLNETLLKEINTANNSCYSTVHLETEGNNLEAGTWGVFNQIITSTNLKPGTAIVSDEWNWFYKDSKAKGKTFTISAENIYYSDKVQYTIVDTYNNNNFTQKTGIEDKYDLYYGSVVVSAEEYNALFGKDYFQSSVYVKDTANVESTLSKLEALGYKCLYVKDTIKSYGGNWVVVDRIINTILYGVLVVVLFVISYLIIRLIMKSRNVYYATVRMLGATKADCGSIIRTDLVIVFNIAFIIVIGAIVCASFGLINLDITYTVLRFMKIKDYIVLYLFLAIIAEGLSYFYSRQLFKNTAMNVYKEV